MELADTLKQELNLRWIREHWDVSTMIACEKWVGRSCLGECCWAGTFPRVDP